MGLESRYIRMIEQTILLRDLVQNEAILWNNRLKNLLALQLIV